MGIPARTHTLAGIRQGEDVTVAGRIMLVREFGGIVFVVLRDWWGDHRLALTRDRSGDALDRFTTDTDIGDHITATAGASRPCSATSSWRRTSGSSRSGPSCPPSARTSRTDVTPLTRRHRTDPRLAERWDLVAFGTELGTAYSELTDPVEQRRFLTAQSLLAAGGDPEAMELDEDFLDALEHSMPPTGGLGIGVDRLVMFLTGLTIRETLPFPLVRRR